MFGCLSSDNNNGVGTVIYKEDNIVSKGLRGLGNCALLIEVSSCDLLSYANSACKIAM